MNAVLHSPGVAVSHPADCVQGFHHQSERVLRLIGWSTVPSEMFQPLPLAGNTCFTVGDQRVNLAYGLPHRNSYAH